MSCSGRPELEDLIDQVVSPKANYCLTIPVVAALHEMSPKTFDRCRFTCVTDRSVTCAFRYAVQDVFLLFVSSLGLENALIMLR